MTGSGREGHEETGRRDEETRSCHEEICCAVVPRCSNGYYHEETGSGHEVCDTEVLRCSTGYCHNHEEVCHAEVQRGCHDYGKV